MTRYLSNFQQWKRQVDRCIEARIGLSSDDLPDVAYRDMFDYGDSPDEAAVAALEEAGFPCCPAR